MQVNLQKPAVYIVRKLCASADLLGSKPKLLGQLINLLGSSNSEVYLILYQVNFLLSGNLPL